VPASRPARSGTASTCINNRARACPRLSDVRRYSPAEAISRKVTVPRLHSSGKTRQYRRIAKPLTHTHGQVDNARRNRNGCAYGSAGSLRAPHALSYERKTGPSLKKKEQGNQPGGGQKHPNHPSEDCKRFSSHERTSVRQPVESLIQIKEPTRTLRYYRVAPSQNVGCSGTRGVREAFG
jgi:hypothetical protein